MGKSKWGNKEANWLHNDKPQMAKCGPADMGSTGMARKRDTTTTTCRRTTCSRAKNVTGVAQKATTGNGQRNKIRHTTHAGRTKKSRPMVSKRHTNTTK